MGVGVGVGAGVWARGSRLLKGATTREDQQAGAGDPAQGVTAGSRSSSSSSGRCRNRLWRWRRVYLGLLARLPPVTPR